MKSLFIKLLAIAAIISGVFYFLTTPLGEGIYEKVSNQFVPCSSPVTYSIGTFDSRFGISKADFLSAINEAAKIWEKPISKQLFAYSDNGGLKISLAYDLRQETTNKLSSFGLVIKDNKESYNELKAKYDSLTAQYNTAKSEFDAEGAAYETKKAAYEKAVALWNSKGGAPQDIYSQLNQTRNSLNAELNVLQQKQNSVNSIANDVNAVSEALNRLVDVLNLNVQKYNSISNENGNEFEEGVYVSDSTGQKIDIYQFENHDKLVRVLAHELGHALGFQHTDNPRDIMYKLNQSVNENLTPNDIAQVKSRCGIK